MFGLEERRRFHGKKDFLILALLVVCALTGYFFFSLRNNGQQPVAVVTVNGEEVLQIDLQDADDQTISLEEQGVPVHFQIQDHRIRFVNVSCPDHICERTGYIGHPGESAICMPNRTVLAIYAAQEV